jgi:hypothetical protein
MAKRNSSRYGTTKPPLVLAATPRARIRHRIGAGGTGLAAAQAAGVTGRTEVGGRRARVTGGGCEGWVVILRRLVGISSGRHGVLRPGAA